MTTIVPPNGAETNAIADPNPPTSAKTEVVVELDPASVGAETEVELPEPQEIVDLVLLVGASDSTANLTSVDRAAPISKVPTQLDCAALTMGDLDLFMYTRALNALLGPV